jgi:hypothetical protein
MGVSELIRFWPSLGGYSNFFFFLFLLSYGASGVENAYFYSISYRYCVPQCVIVRIPFSSNDEIVRERAKFFKSLWECVQWWPVHASGYATKSKAQNPISIERIATMINRRSARMTQWTISATCSPHRQCTAGMCMAHLDTCPHSQRPADTSPHFPP